MQLQDKIAMITGASSGVGRAAALLFAREGARVVITARRSQELDIVADEIRQEGGEALAVAGDVRDEAQVMRVVEAAVDAFGGLDIAFNNAGIPGTIAPLHDLTRDAWDEAIGANLTSAWLCAKHQVPLMLARGGGSIIFTSSFVGTSAGTPGMGAYAAAKAGLSGLTQVLAAENGAGGIRANAILAGGIDTSINPINMPGVPAEVKEWVVGLHALGRIADPVEIAQCALFLASDSSSFVTGATIAADGGVAIYRR